MALCPGFLLHPQNPSSANLVEPHLGETSHLVEGLLWAGPVEQGHQEGLGWGRVGRPQTPDRLREVPWRLAASLSQPGLSAGTLAKNTRVSEPPELPPRTRNHKCALQPSCKRLAKGPIGQMRKLRSCTQ